MSLECSTGGCLSRGPWLGAGQARALRHCGRAPGAPGTDLEDGQRTPEYHEKTRGTGPRATGKSRPGGFSYPGKHQDPEGSPMLNAAARDDSGLTYD